MANFTVNNINPIVKKALIVALVVITAFLPGFAEYGVANAVEPLRISNIVVDVNDTSATVSWNTNLPATGLVEYGLHQDNYPFQVSTNLKKTSQVITLNGLFPDTRYFIKITAFGDFSETSTFSQSFESEEFADSKAPTISDVSVIWVTGTTATIQWTTDEDSSTEVDYGLTTNYGSNRRDGKLVRDHDITISGLAQSTTYQFQIKSKDKDGNIAKWFNMQFRTSDTRHAENDDLTIYSITPTSQNDSDVKANSVVVTWRTNKVAEGIVRYGTNPNPGTTIRTNPPRDFAHAISLTGLTAGTTYYFQIEAKDIFGKSIKSPVMSVITDSNGTTNSNGSTGDNDNGTILPNITGQVLGSSFCDPTVGYGANGFYGAYYNLPSTHPDMELKGRFNSKKGPENDWYSDTYYEFSRIDSQLAFDPFFPIESKLAGDPSHFAVHWRAYFNVPVAGSYPFTLYSDDDSWIYIDDVIAVSNGGLHGPVKLTRDVTLSAGLHTIDIYYADRKTPSASFSFVGDSRFNFLSLPIGCDIDRNSATGGNPDENGQVLGSSNFGDFTTNGTTPTNTTVPARPVYACNPDLGYTKIKRLFKTSASPDIWALLETGQRHYITSPESFALYECDWNLVEVVSEKYLHQFASATLVRTPSDPVIYHLFQRPNRQWLKINIPSPTVFISYPNNYWGNVARINHLDMAAYPNARLIKADNNPAVYLIDGNNKRHIANEQVFMREHFEWFEIVTINDLHFESYQTGPVLQ